MEIRIENLEQLPQAVTQFIEAMDDRTVYAFRGEMGAGKTTFITELCRQLGVDDVANSPTFAIVNEYRSDTTAELIYHFDFYRIEEIEEVFDLGYEEYFYSGDLCLVEWPEKIEPLLPDDAMTVRITVGEDEHRIFEIE